MTSLSELPSLCLHNIVSHLAVPDLLPFALSCRDLLSYSQARLITEKGLSEKFNSIRIGSCGNCPTRDDISLPAAIKYLQDNPSIIWHIRTIKFTPFFSDGRKTKTSIHPLDACDLERFITMCAPSWYDQAMIQEVIDDIPRWPAVVDFATIQEETDYQRWLGTLFTLLLTQLRGLRRLELHSLVHATFEPLTELAFQCVLGERQIADHHALDTVREIYVDHWDTEDGELLSYLNPLRFLPKLEYLSGFMIAGNDYYSTHENLVSARTLDLEKQLLTKATSPVKKIKFTYSGIDPDQLFSFIEPMHHLEVLMHENSDNQFMMDDIEDFYYQFDGHGIYWLEQRGLISAQAGQWFIICRDGEVEGIVEELVAEKRLDEVEGRSITIKDEGVWKLKTVCPDGSILLKPIVQEFVFYEQRP